MCAKCNDIIQEDDIQSIVECADCSNVIAEDDEQFTNSNDEIICESCSEDYNTCELCVNITNSDDTTWIESEQSVICTSCLNDHYFQCNDCDRYCRDNDQQTTINGDRICQSCYEDNYFCCDCCNEIMSNDEYSDDGECNSCHSSREEEIDGLYNYSYKPEPIFQSTIKDKRSGTIKGTNIEDYSSYKKLNYLGIELEHSVGIDSKAEIIESIYDIIKNVYYKEDGSLDDGIELVTHPMEFNSIDWANWAKVLKYLRSRSCKSYDTSYSCGLHIHINTKAFGNFGLLKAHYLSAKVENFLRKISKRTQSNWRCWTAPSNINYSDMDSFQREIVTSRIKRYEQIRNVPRGAFNYTGSTIELRMFRGTLNMDGFRACVEFAKDISFILSQVSLTYLINHSEAEIEAYIVNNLRPTTKDLLIKTNRIKQPDTQDCIDKQLESLSDDIIPDVEMSF